MAGLKLYIIYLSQIIRTKSLKNDLGNFIKIMHRNVKLKYSSRSYFIRGSKMRSNSNYDPKNDYMMMVPEIKPDDDGMMLIDFEDIELEFNEKLIDHNQMLNDSSVETRVFNELFLNKQAEFLNIWELDVSYPLFM